MNPYGSLSDDFYANVTLQTEMDLPTGRDSVLHFFEQMQRRFPKLQHFYQRERGEFILEEEKEHGAYRWVAVESKRISSGVVNPNTLDEAMEQHHEVLDMAPYMLSVSRLDCEAISLMYGFDYAYRGNHNQLLADAIGLPTGLEAITQRSGSQLMAYEPMVQISLDDVFRTHARINFEPRTGSFQPRGPEFPDEMLSVYVTVRRFDSLGPDESFSEELKRLDRLMRGLMDDYVIEHILKPLQNSIAIR
ncbi:MAG: hypothetical protein MUF23_10925 [Pirellula sp.]|jgi:hypothetical protein|nr:hypothetical protein [Pirellula sp.]